MRVLNNVSILIVFICICTISCTIKSPGGKQPVAVNGIIDLKNWDFEKDGPVPLDGEWKFKWKESDISFASPDYDDSGWGVFSVPGFWDYKSYPRYGSAWFRLKVINMQSNQLCALYLQNSLTEYELYVNGKIVLKNGKPGRTRDESVPQRITLYAPLNNNHEFELAWYISNFTDIHGGPRNSLKIGLYDDIKNGYFLKNFFIFLVFGLVLLMAVYHFIFWLFLKEDNANLYFSLFCIIISVHMLLFDGIISQMFPAVYMYELLSKIELLVMPCGLIVFLIFFKKLFPFEFSGLLFKIISIISIVFIILNITCPMWVAFIIMNIYFFILIISGTWLIKMIITALIRKRPASLIMFFGIIVLVLTMVTDIVLLSFPAYYMSTLHLGMVGFLLCQSIILSRRFASMYKTTKYLSENLQDEVNKQTKIIREKNEELTRLTREKTDYFINLAHETKTPLTLITNYLQKYISERGVDENLAVIKENFEKLKTDMVNFLDYEKLVKGQTFYNHDQVADFSAILKSRIILFKENARNSEIFVESSIAGEVYIKADPFAIDRIVNNLIDNAIKYTQKEGEIFIILEKKGDTVVFLVRDTGIGIPDEQQKYIFDPYYQVSHKKRNIQGMGMGLNIVKKIIDELEGEITIESEVNRGTTFKVILKKHAIGTREKIHNDINSDTIVSKKKQKQPETVKIIKGRYNVFVVEDNLDMLNYLQDNLKDTYNVFYAINGNEALKKIDHIPVPSIIISDIMMDVMDGYEFFERLKLKVEYNFIPFIFLTAITSKDKRLMGIKRGAVDFISKPFSIDELLAKIESLIRLQESQKIRSELEMEERILNAMRYRKAKDEEIYVFEDKCSVFGITEREKDIIRMLLKGMADKEISDGLYISYHTLRAHIRNIYKKCSIQNRVELVNIFINK